MKKKNQILPGTSAWDSLCEMCGLCCLVKTIDEHGRVCLTRVRCKHLNPTTKLCDCYNQDFSKRNADHDDSCFSNNGSPVNFDTLHNDYVVPGFCPYVKKFVQPNALTRPVLNLQDTISESELPNGANLSEYIIPGTGKYFTYNPIVSKKIKDIYTK